MPAQADEECALDVKPARSPWALSILISTLLTCGTLGAEVQPPLLDPPLGHWLYDLPEAEQTALVTVSVQVLDEQGKPVSKATILAHCFPWHCVLRQTTDESGHAVLQGPLGDWTLYAGRRGYLAVQRDVIVVQDCEIIIAAEDRMALCPKEAVPSEVAYELSRGYCAVTIDLEDIPDPPTSRLSIGSLSNSALELSGTPEIRGWVWITRDASADQPGLALGYPYETGEPNQGPHLRDGVSRLRIHFDGFGEEVRTVVNFTNLDQVCHTGYVAYYVPPEGGEAIIWVAPGVYQVGLSVPGAGKNIAYLPQTLRCEPNDAHELHWGSTFGVQARVLNWMSNQLHLWFDIVDNRGNYLLQLPSGDAHVRLTQDEDLIYEGPTFEGRSRHVRLDLDWEPCWQKQTPISYEYWVSNPATGELHATGSFPSDPDIALSAGNLPVTYLSEHFEFRLLDLPPDRGQRLAEGLETALYWLFAGYAGPVSPPDGRWPLESKAPVGVGWSGGNRFSVSVYAGSLLEPQRPEGNTFVLFHELGHCYQASTPHHQASGMGSTTCESNATLLAAYCMKAVQGERGFRYMQETYADRFFGKLQSDTLDGTPGPDEYDFVYFYLHNRYGQDVHRAFQRIMYRSEGNVAAILLSADFLASEAERSAAIYSFLCGDNLAWLYRWIGEDVTDEVIDKALAYFGEQGAAVPESPSVH
jgi:hypothetical protein